MSISHIEIYYNNLKVILEVIMRIRDLREDRDLTQKEIAEYLHIKQNTYSQYENEQRQIPINFLIALAKYYNTSTDYILGLTNNPKAYK